MIEITAKLSRGPVYFTSEEITCYVTFKNVHAKDVNLDHRFASSSDQDNVSLNSNNSSGYGDQSVQSGNQSVNSRTSSDQTEILALAGAQLYCHCSLDEAKVKFISPASDSEPNNSDKSDTISLSSTSSLSIFSSSTNSSSNYHSLQLQSRDTSFNPAKSERGHVIYSSSPKILFCMLQLAPNESKTFVFSERLPLNSPPSYYGTSIKYLYKLTVGTQRLGSVIQLLRIPLRILSFEESKEPKKITHRLPASTGDANNKETSNGAKSMIGLRPSVSSQTSITSDSGDFDGSELDIIIHKLDNLTTKRTQSSFVISNHGSKVAKFSLVKTSYKLGEDIIGSFDFTDAQVPCVQFIVTLQSEEAIKDECNVQLVNKPVKNPSSGVLVNNHSSVDEYVLQTSNTHIILPIPLTVTPGFATNIVTLTWKLHFEFIIMKKEELMNKPEVVDVQGKMIKQPETINVQTMFWDLPIEIHPNNPLTISRGLQLPVSSTLVF